MQICFIRCVFSLENIQAGVTDGDQLLKNSQHWSTEATQTKSFNDFVFFSIRVLKRVINNGLTSSSWHFSHFFYMNNKTAEVTDQIIR